MLEGRTVLDTEAGIFVPPEKRRAGLVFQDARLFPHMSVEKNLLFGWRRSAVARQARTRSREPIALLGLETSADSARRSISPAAKKAAWRWAARLLASPDILLLDEPLASLDAARRAEILPWLERLRDIARIPIFYVSHSLDEVARLADRVVLLDAGRVTRARQRLRSSGRAGRGKASGRGAGSHGRRNPGRPQHIAFRRRQAAGRAKRARPGKRVRVRIGADEILIAREAPKAISANNILPVTISGVRLDGARAEVEMRCGSARLVARITAASVQRLQLAAGVAAFAVIKSVIVEGRLNAAPLKTSFFDR